MNTDINISVFSELPELQVDEKITEAFEVFSRIVKKYSRFSPDSELSKINQAVTNPRTIDKEFHDLAEYCIKMFELSNGIFDFTIIDLLEAIGYKNSYVPGKTDEQLTLKDIEEIVSTRPSVSEIGLTGEPEYSISLAKNQRIEFGGCLKGYSVDLAFQKLLPLENFLIDAGGDIRVSGHKFVNEKSENWLAGLWNGENEIKEYIPLNSGDTVTCSGSAARKFANLHHLINPKKIDFTKNYSHCFIYGNSLEFSPNENEKNIKLFSRENLCMLADTFATIAFIMGEENVKGILPKGMYVKYY